MIHNIWSFRFIPQAWCRPECLEADELFDDDLVSVSRAIKAKKSLARLHLNDHVLSLEWFDNAARCAVLEGFQAFEFLCMKVGLSAAKTSIRKTIDADQVKLLYQHFDSKLIEALVFDGGAIALSSEVDTRVKRYIKTFSGDWLNPQNIGCVGYALFLSQPWPLAVKRRLGFMAPNAWMTSTPTHIACPEPEFITLIASIKQVPH